jgi:hypothetical protein
MVNSAKYVLLLLGGSLIAGCAPSIRLKVLEPADVMVPPHIDTVAVVARTRPSTAGQTVLGVLEGALTGEAIGADWEGAAQAKQGVVAALAESPRYGVVLPTIELEGVGSGVAAAPLPWQQVERICRDVDAQGLVVLEAFDTDSHVHEHAETRTKTNDAGKEVHYKVFHAHRETSMSSTWRFYDAMNRILIDELYDREHARSWEAEGPTPGEARGRLPPQINTIRDVAYDAGHDYGRRIAPSWLWVKRSYYGKGDDGLKEAKGHVRADEWPQARALWAQLAESPDPKIRGKALFNLALAEERAGALEAAVELARKADVALGKGRTRSYVSELESRRGKELRLEQQMRQPPPPPPEHAPPPPPEPAQDELEPVEEAPAPAEETAEPEQGDSDQE